jgi:GH15 family glucan-1,4-alpha-glucosidase
VLETRFETGTGAFRVLDFAPRFLLYDRAFRPTQMVRIVEPIDGLPRIRVRCDPRLGWSNAIPEQLHGSNHVRYEGFESQLPVRIGYGAAHQSQNDIFGEMVLALAPIFLDERFTAERSPQTLGLLERLARKAIEVAGTPDAGIWEHRTEMKPRTFSSLMCWAAADRMAKVARLHAPSSEAEYRSGADRIREEMLRRAWSPGVGSFVSTYDGAELDAALLQMPSLRLLPLGDHRLHGTIDAIRKTLSRDGWLFRYRRDDGFGQPKVAFIICTFWLIEALAAVGRNEEAKEEMNRAQAALSPLGLLSEDYEAWNLRMWGNFPQAYSHVGLIHAAFAASPRWADVL